MILCMPHRMFFAMMATIGYFLINGNRTVFDLAISHASRRSTEESPGNVSDLLQCTVSNTSRDFKDQFQTSAVMLFGTIFFAATNVGSILGSVCASYIPADLVVGASVLGQGVLYLVISPVARAGWDLTLGFIRLLCGLCDGASQAVLVFMIGSWAFPNEKSRHMAWTMLGRTLGNGGASILLSLTICFVSWDSGLFIFGSMGVLWFIIWLKTSYSVPRDCPYLLDEELHGYPEKQLKVRSGCQMVAGQVPYKAILTSVPVWCIWLGRFSNAWTNTTLTTLQPLFFKDVFAFSIADFALIMCLQPFGKAASVMLGAYLSQYLMERHGTSLTMVRKLMQLVGNLGECACLLCVTFLTDWRLSFFCFTLTLMATGFSENGHRCNQVDLSLHFSNIVAGFTMTGLVGAALNTFFSYIVSNLVHQQQRQQQHLEWKLIFLANAALSLTTALLYGWLASGEFQVWDTVMENGPAVSADEKERLVKYGAPVQQRDNAFTDNLGFALEMEKDRESGGPTRKKE